MLREKNCLGQENPVKYGDRKYYGDVAKKNRPAKNEVDDRIKEMSMPIVFHHFLQPALITDTIHS